MNVRTKLEVHNFTRSWDNSFYPQNLRSPWISQAKVILHHSNKFYVTGYVYIQSNLI